MEVDGQEWCVSGIQREQKYAVLSSEKRRGSGTRSKSNRWNFLDGSRLGNILLVGYK
jgi:hypothetical protein